MSELTTIGGHADKREIRRRLSIVERSMTEIGWSVRLAEQLAEQLGVSKRTIYRYRSEVLEELANAYRGADVEEERSEFVVRLHAHQRAALKAGKFGPLAAMMSIEAKVRGLDKPTQAQKLVIAALSPDELAEKRRAIAARLLAANGGHDDE